MNLEYLKLLYCEFQKYVVMTLSVVGGQQKNTQIPVIRQQNASKAFFLISDFKRSGGHDLLLIFTTVYILPITQRNIKRMSNFTCHVKFK